MVGIKVNDTQKKEIINYVAEGVFIIVVCLIISNVQYNNGRIVMCKELGGNYTSDDICVNPSLIETKDQYNDLKSGFVFNDNLKILGVEE